MIRRGDIGTVVLALWALCSAVGPAKSEDAQLGVAQAARGAESAGLSTLQLPNIGISADPTAANETTGVGWLGRRLGAEHPGIQLRGLWLGAGNYLMSGGIDPGLTFNSSLSVNLLVDLERTSGLKGSSFSAKFLQVNTDPTSTDAGSVMGYNSLVGLEPYNRSELYEIWWHQTLFDDRFAFRVGKINASARFQAAVNPPHAPDIGTVSNLLYVPVFELPTLYSVLPGYDNTAFGITGTWNLSKALHLSYGVFDGNQARGVATGLRGPEFNGYYFHIAEIGMNWRSGPERKPGSLAIGGWRQTGTLSTDDGLIKQDGAEGAYVVGTQQLWYRDAHPINDAGVTGFFQFGWNDGKTLPFNYYVGAGLTARGLVRHRPEDSFGGGMAWGWLNPNLYANNSELMFQTYYQAHVSGQTHLQTTLTYIPRPGQEPGLDAAWAVTQEIIMPF